MPKNIRKNVIDEQPINYFDKVKAWLDNQNKFENLELLSEVASQQNYLKQSDKLNTKVINQLENKYLTNISNLNQKLKIF
ncbi:hypothetical protein [Spiroplasma endosymbiont of Notiophilus biguttatus]|uniref:hypothetical protein n=1 Tax=Spiroplasma endosymbiont of Notiophilus biguttatus TaxID=3066285 RepID=UPI00313ADFFB